MHNNAEQGGGSENFTFLLPFLGVHTGNRENQDGERCGAAAVSLMPINKAVKNRPYDRVGELQ